LTSSHRRIFSAAPCAPRRRHLHARRCAGYRPPSVVPWARAGGHSRVRVAGGVRDGERRPRTDARVLLAATDGVRLAAGAGRRETL